jgi:transcriptional regulator GlxA family with amidase domain
MQPKRLGILIFPDVEVLDFCGPFEVFSVARSSRDQVQGPFEVRLVAEQDGPVTAVGGLRVLPDYTLQTCPTLDILLVPGGSGARRSMDNTTLVQWVATRGRQVELLASVCTGAFLLAKAGLLDGRRATTHWEFTRLLADTFPNVSVVENTRYVEDGQVITSAGISAGIDMALHLVARYLGDNAARGTARQMEYPFPAA